MGKVDGVLRSLTWLGPKVSSVGDIGGDTRMV